MKKKWFVLSVCMGLIIGFAHAQVNGDNNQGKKQDDTRAVTANFTLEGDEGRCGTFRDAITEGEGIISVDKKWFRNELEVTYNPEMITIEEVTSRMAERDYVPIERVRDAQDVPETDPDEIVMVCRHEEMHKEMHEDMDRDMRK